MFGFIKRISDAIRQIPEGECLSDGEVLTVAQDSEWALRRFRPRVMHFQRCSICRPKVEAAMDNFEAIKKKGALT